MHKCVERVQLVSASLSDELVERHRLKSDTIVSGRHVGVVGVVAELLILGVESVDELVACVSHAVSMAENGAKVKR